MPDSDADEDEDSGSGAVLTQRLGPFVLPEKLFEAVLKRCRPVPKIQEYGNLRYGASGDG